MDFRELLIEARLSHVPSAADFLGVTPRTIYHYLRYGAPKMALQALALRAGRDPAWIGYQIHGERLIRPDGHFWTRRDLDNWEWLIQREHLLGQVQQQRLLDI